MFMETSALDGSNVQLAFTQVLAEIHKVVSTATPKSEESGLKPGQGKAVIQWLDSSKKKNRAGCC